MALLEVKNLTKNFGGLTAVGDVTMELNEGELVGLIGPNGAGKTTLFNLLTGVYEPSEGTITLDGQLLNGKAPYKIAAGGLGRTFQNIRLFKDLSFGQCLDCLCQSPQTTCLCESFPLAKLLQE